MEELLGLFPGEVGLQDAAGVVGGRQQVKTDKLSAVTYHRHMGICWGRATEGTGNPSVDQHSVCSFGILEVESQDDLGVLAAELFEGLEPGHRAGSCDRLVSLYCLWLGDGGSVAAGSGAGVALS